MRYVKSSTWLVDKYTLFVYVCVVIYQYFAKILHEFHATLALTATHIVSCGLVAVKNLTNTVITCHNLSRLRVEL